MPLKGILEAFPQPSKGLEAFRRPSKAVIWGLFETAEHVMRAL